MNNFTQSERDTIASIRQTFGNDQGMWDAFHLYCWLAGWYPYPPKIKE